MNLKTAEAADHILRHCGSLVSGETALIVSDPATEEIAAIFLDQASAHNAVASLVVIPQASRHGTEPPHEVATAMQTADLTLSLCTMSLAHSRARLAAGAMGRRFLSLPAFSRKILDDPCIRVDYRSQEPKVRKVADAFTTGMSVQVRNEAGTSIDLRVDGRVGNTCPGFVNSEHLLGSPPDIEANVSPVENSAEGTAVIDGSVACPETGLLSQPLTLDISGGAIRAIHGDDMEIVKFLETQLGKSDSKRRILAECGVGLNPLARLTGHMLTDEGALGSVHFGFGSNYTVGGLNKVDFHLDFVMRNASVAVDGVDVIRRGDVL